MWPWQQQMVVLTRGPLMPATPRGPWTPATPCWHKIGTTYWWRKKNRHDYNYMRCLSKTVLECKMMFAWVNLAGCVHLCSTIFVNWYTSLQLARSHTQISTVTVGWWCVHVYFGFEREERKRRRREERKTGRRREERRRRKWREWESNQRPGSA